MEDFREQVKKSFNKCKTDIETLKDENYLFKNKLKEAQDENSELKSEINSLKSELSELKGELKGMKIAIDYIKDFKEPNQNTTQEEKTQSNIDEIQSNIPATTNKTPKSDNRAQKDPYEALLAFKAKTNKREMLKQKLISMISETGMYLSELKFLFVEHYRYCSKATFYNYLKELELERNIKIERNSGKNIVYAYNLMQKEI